MSIVKVMTAICLTIISFLTACATSDPVRTPSGRQGFAINCSGGARWQDCYDEAGQLCPRGYEVVDRIGDSNTVIGTRDDDIHINTMVRREMIIECR